MIEIVRSLPLEADEVDVVGRRLEGRVLAWDTLYRVTDDGQNFYEEGFLRGSTEHSLRARRNTFELRHEHLDERIGLVGFSEAEDGLMFVATLDNTNEGDRELDALRAHTRSGVSIRYSPMRNKPRGGPPWWRHTVEVRELSLTSRPQYHDAKVLAVRAKPARTWQRPADVSQLLDWTPPDLV